MAACWAAATAATAALRWAPRVAIPARTAAAAAAEAAVRGARHQRKRPRLRPAAREMQTMGATRPVEVGGACRCCTLCSCRHACRSADVASLEWGACSGVSQLLVPPGLLQGAAAATATAAAAQPLHPRLKAAPRATTTATMREAAMPAATPAATPAAEGAMATAAAAAPSSEVSPGWVAPAAFPTERHGQQCHRFFYK